MDAVGVGDAGREGVAVGELKGENGRDGRVWRPRVNLVTLGPIWLGLLGLSGPSRSATPVPE